MKRMVIPIAKLIERLNWFLVTVSGAFMCFMVFIIVHGVFMRYVLHHPKAYSVELSGYALMPLTAFALAYTQKVRGHVRVDLLTMHLPTKVQKALHIVTYVIFLVYAAGLTWAGWKLTSVYFSKHMRSVEAGVPLWWVAVALVIGLAILCLQLLLDIGKAVAELRGKAGRPEGGKSVSSHLEKGR